MASFRDIPDDIGSGYLTTIPQLRTKQKAKSLCNESYVHDIVLKKDQKDQSRIIVSCKCFASQCKSKAPHQTYLEIDTNKTKQITNSHCTCKAG